MTMMGTACSHGLKSIRELSLVCPAPVLICIHIKADVFLIFTA